MSLSNEAPYFPTFVNKVPFAQDNLEVVRLVVREDGFSARKNK
jgi:hypothetical protein